MDRQTLVAVSAVVGLVLGTGTGHAGEEADWPCWRGPNGDGRTKVRGITTDWSGGLKKVWEFRELCPHWVRPNKRTAKTLYGMSYSAPIVKGDRLVALGRFESAGGKPGSDAVFCLNADTGKLLWKKLYDAPRLSKTHQAGSGPHATPAMDDQRAYAYSAFGQISAWNLADGKEVWRKSVLDEGGKIPGYGFTTSPLLCGENVIVEGGGSAQVIAFEKATGKVAWKAGNGDAMYASPISATINGQRQVIAVVGESVLGLDPKIGKELWKVPFAPRRGRGHCHATPVVAGDVVFVSSSYYPDKSKAIRITPSGAKLLWSSKEFFTCFTDPVVVGAYMYAYCGTRNVHIPAYFKCVEVKTGKVVWSEKVPTQGTLVFVDGYLLARPYGGYLTLIRPTPDGLRKITEWKTKRPGGSWTVPVIARGKLYLRHGTNLVCYNLMK